MMMDYNDSMNLRRTRCKPEKKAFAKQLRLNQSFPEKIIWQRVRRKSLGCRINRQVLIMGYIVDFWCPSKKIAIEIDGKSYHNSNKDKRRDSNLARIGIYTLRISAKVAIKETNRAIEMIKSALSF